MKLQFYLKPKYVIIGLVLLIGFGFYQANKPVEYAFSSVYDVETNHHNVQLKSNSNSDRYNERCADDLAENLENRSWEYQAIATSALKSYPGDTTFRILVKNLSSSNWHVRQNSAISCEKLGYTYQDLINVFDGNDRYAREIIRYRLDRRNAEEAVKA